MPEPSPTFCHVDGKTCLQRLVTVGEPHQYSCDKDEHENEGADACEQLPHARRRPHKPAVQMEHGVEEWQTLRASGHLSGVLVDIDGGAAGLGEAHLISAGAVGEDSNARDAYRVGQCLLHLLHQLLHRDRFSLCFFHEIQFRLYSLRNLLLEYEHSSREAHQCDDDARRHR